MARILPALILSLLAVACSGEASPSSESQALYTPKFEEDTVERAATNYVLYGEEFITENDFHPDFVASIKGALCDAVGWDSDSGQITWTIVCWLSIEKGAPDLFRDNTIHPMTIGFDEETFDSYVID